MGPDDLRCLIQTHWDLGPYALLAQQKLSYADLNCHSTLIDDSGSTEEIADDLWKSL
jgi:hypothetical protein